MRALVFLLILANLIFFAWSRGYFGAARGADALRVDQQLLAERIRVVSRDEPPVNKAPVDKAPVEKTPIAFKAPEKKVEEKRTDELCLRLADLPPADAARLEALVADTLPGYRVQRSASAGAAAYWVFIPPLATRAEVERKVGELKRLGVPELYVVQDAGPDRLAISLGIFSTAEAARERLEELRAKSVRSAKIGERPGRAATIALELRGPRSDALAQAVAQALPEAKPGCLPTVVATQ